MIAIAVEESGLLHRLALYTLSFCGTSDRLLLLGFMAPTAFCSMWISDTATTAMMVKTVQAVLDETESETRPSYHDSEPSINYGTFSELRKEIEGNGMVNSNQVEIDSCYSSRSSKSGARLRHPDENYLKCNKAQKRHV